MMKIIETVITVLPDGSVQLPPQPGLPPGAHRVVLVVEDVAPQPAAPTPLPLKLLDFAAWPAASTYRREDLYTTTGVESLFLDTNALVYAADRHSPLQPVAAATLQAARDDGVPLVVSPQVLREYLAVAQDSAKR